MKRFATITARVVAVALVAVALMLPMVVQAQVTSLTLDTPAADNQFGRSVSLTAEGQRAIVGAWLYDVDGVTDVGAAIVFNRDENGSWTQAATLTADDGAEADNLGRSVAISSDGQYAVVGSFLDDVGGNTNQGSAYVFARNQDGSWTQEAKLVADDGMADDLFGRSVTIDGNGNRLVVGAWLHDVDGNADQGAAYVFTRDASGNWTLEAKLTGSGTANSVFPNFGEAVAIDTAGERVVVGSRLDDINGEDSNEGRAYVFARNEDGTWTESAILSADDAQPADFFGGSENGSRAVDISGDGNTIVVGAMLEDADDTTQDEGSAYVFAYDASGGTWSQEAKLTASLTGAATFPNFGEAVAIDDTGTRVLVGAKLDDISETDSNEGRAYVFVRSSDGGWTEVAVLEGDAPEPGDFFGEAVALSGNGQWGLVGARFDESETLAGDDNNAGAVYAFGPEALRVAVTPVDVPAAFDLSGIYPNPLQDRGAVELSVPTTQQVSVSLYNALGQRVRVVHEGVVPGGSAERITFEADGLPNGVYVLRVLGEDFSAQQKFVLVR